MRSLPLRPNGKDLPLMKDPIQLILIDSHCRSNNDNDEAVSALNAENQGIMHENVNQNHSTLQGRVITTTANAHFNQTIREVPFIHNSLIDHRRPLTPTTHCLHTYAELTLEPHMTMM